MAENSLKRKNNKFILAFVVLNLLLLTWINQGSSISFEQILVNLNEFSFSDSFLLFAGVISYIANGVLPVCIKNTIIFLRLKNNLPGCWAFSNSMHRDYRIDPKRLIQKYGSLPTAPDDQNRLWYQIYQKHQDFPAVKETHKLFLLMRDLSGIALLFGCGYSVTYALTDMAGNSFIIGILILIVEFLGVWMSARNYGVRFVTNVLAIETSRI